GSPTPEDSAMPKPVPIPVWRKLLQRAQQGESTASLAAAFGLPPRTVRHLRKRFRDRGPDGVNAPPPKGGGFVVTDSSPVPSKARLKGSHPRWAESRPTAGGLEASPPEVG
ncbi:MAG TPA: helix-turn-helix domain-containing protein, partial [Gemmata sp.]|nr:helix-turn-helix domain-containing protein [Gemmata sp.]